MAEFLDFMAYGCLYLLILGVIERLVKGGGNELY